MNTPNKPLCKICSSEFHYQTFCSQKKNKPIKKIGKQTILYNEWRDKQAIPYLIKKYGKVCATCGGSRCGNKQLDLDHIKNRGSHYHLKYSLCNVQLLGRYPCHQEKTDNVNTKEK